MLIIMSKYTAKRSRCKVVSLHLLLFLIIFAVERKPELYAIVIILYTILLVQAFHDGFYDRKPDTTSTVFSGPCLVHFVKFIPQFRNILLRDRFLC